MSEMQMDNSFKRFFKWGSSYQNNVIPIAAHGLQGKLSSILSHLNKGVTSFTRWNKTRFIDTEKRPQKTPILYLEGLLFSI